MSCIDGVFAPEREFLCHQGQGQAGGEDDHALEELAGLAASPQMSQCMHDAAMAELLLQPRDPPSRKNKVAPVS